jgi:hypothetical protein
VRVIATCTIALMLTSSARAADVDWKMYGGATADAQSFCFYDANGVGSSVTANDRAGFEPKPGDWEQVPPKGKGANLQKILCPK